MSRETITDAEKKLSKALGRIGRENPQLAEGCIGIALTARAFGKTEELLEFIDSNPDYTYEELCDIVYKDIPPLEITDDDEE